MSIMNAVKRILLLVTNREQNKLEDTHRFRADFEQKAILQLTFIKQAQKGYIQINSLHFNCFAFCFCAIRILGDALSLFRHHH